MNCLVTKVLLKILLEFWIMEPIPSRKRGKRRRRKRTIMSDRVLRMDWLFGCYSQKTKREVKEKENTIEKMLRKEGKRSSMCGNAWTCYVQTKIASWVKTQSKLQYSQVIISHANLECMKHGYNDRECNAWACDNISTKPNQKNFTKTQKPQNFSKNLKT